MIYIWFFGLIKILEEFIAGLFQASDPDGLPGGLTCPEKENCFSISQVINICCGSLDDFRRTLNHGYKVADLG